MYNISLVCAHNTANRWWSVQVNVVDAPIFYIGWEWEAKIHERMCTFQVDGIPGWGISEFMYRNMGPGRPEEYNEKDPEWTRTINKGWKIKIIDTLASDPSNHHQKELELITHLNQRGVGEEEENKNCHCLEVNTMINL